MSQEPKVKITIYDRIHKIGDLFFLNLLVVLSCIPIVTIGAAFTAMYTITIKMVDDREESSVWKAYWKAFKSNFKQSTCAWLIVLCILFVMYVGLMFSYSVNGSALGMVMGIIALSAVYLSFVLPLLFPLIARYENTTANMFKNALVFSIANLDKWFGLFFIWALPVLVYIANRSIFYYTWVLWLVILLATVAYAGSMILVKLFAKLEGKEDAAEDSDNEE